MKYDKHELKRYITRDVFLLASLSDMEISADDLLCDMRRLWPDISMSGLKNVAKRVLEAGWKIEPRSWITRPGQKQLQGLWFTPSEYERFIGVWNKCRKATNEISLVALRCAAISRPSASALAPECP